VGFRLGCLGPVVRDDRGPFFAASHPSVSNSAQRQGPPSLIPPLASDANVTHGRGGPSDEPEGTSVCSAYQAGSRLSCLAEILRGRCRWRAGLETRE